MNKIGDFIPSAIDRLIYSIFTPPAPLVYCQACCWFRYSKREILMAPLPGVTSRAAIEVEKF